MIDLLTCPECDEKNGQLARFCSGCGLRLTTSVDGAESRRTVSILFADLVESTRLASSLDAEALRSVTGRYFAAMRTVVREQGGTVEKFIGDAVVAVFGAPQVREDDALRAVRAAMGMREALDRVNAELLLETSVQLEMRIGVCTGEVAVGAARAGGALATGDAVHVAARLQQTAAAGETLISVETHALVRDMATTEPVEPLLLKGKPDLVAAHRLLGVRPVLDRLELGNWAPFVGRTAELRALVDGFERVRSTGIGELLRVEGSAGIGKSRLAHEFVATLEPGTVLTGRCLNYGPAMTYWPLRQVILDAVGLAGSESLVEAQSVLLTALQGAPDAAAVTARLLTVLGYETDGSTLEDAPWAVRKFLEHLARTLPLVLMIDDLHWAHPGLIGVLEHTVDGSGHSPILVLGLSRPGTAGPWAEWMTRAPDFPLVQISPLDATTSAALVDSRHDVPETVRQRVVDVAAGNPLFAEQLLAMLVDEGRIATDGGHGHWLGDDPSEVSLTTPPTVSALLAARIDLLSASERAVLGGAAVLGTVAYIEGIEQLVSSQVDVRNTVASLSRSEFFRPTVTDLPGLQAFEFRHVLVRDAAYASVSKANRAQWHEQVGDWLVNHAGSMILDEIVGHHLFAAWDHRRQLGLGGDTSRQLAHRAAVRLASASHRLELSDLSAASAMLEQVGELLEPGSPEALDAALSLAQQLLDLGQLDRTQQILSSVADSGSRVQVARAAVLSCRASTFAQEFDYDAQLAAVTAAIDVLAEQGNASHLATAYIVQAELHLYRWRMGQARASLEQALAAAEIAHDVTVKGRANIVLGVMFLFDSTPAEEVIARLNAMIEGSDSNPHFKADAEQVLCVMHAMCGRIEQARAVAESARQGLIDVGSKLFLANIAQSTGHVEELAGDVAQALAEYASSCQALADLGEHSYLSTVAGMHACLLGREGLWTECQAAIDLATEHGTDDDDSTQVLIFQAKAFLACGKGDAEGARAAVAAALAQGSGGESPDQLAECYRTGADVEHLLGDVRAEEAHLRSAAALFAEKGNLVRQREMQARLREA